MEFKDDIHFMFFFIYSILILIDYFPKNDAFIVKKEALANVITKQCEVTYASCNTQQCRGKENTFSSSELFNGELQVFQNMRRVTEMPVWRKTDFMQIILAF